MNVDTTIKTLSMKVEECHDRLDVILGSRRDYLKEPIRTAEMNLGRCRRRAGQLESEVGTFIHKHGDDSSNHKLRQLRAQLENVKSDREHWSKRLKELRQMLADAESDQILLHDAVSTYLRGATPNETCGTIKLFVHPITGTLYIHFRKDGKRASQQVFDGRIMISYDKGDLNSQLL